jgi:pimeloyl-ACP methyl ester carboxylesterase
MSHDIKNAAVQQLDAEARRVESPCGDGNMVWRSWGRSSDNSSDNNSDNNNRPALVLLHGGAGSWLHWVRTVPAFSATHRVLVPDLPGLGESANPPAGADMPTIAAIVAAGIDAQLALLHKERMRSLTLLGAGGLVRPATPMTLERIRDKTGDALMEAHRTNLARTMVADPAKIDDLALEIQAWNARHSRLDTPALIQLRPLAVSLPQLRIPVNAIWGERDQVAYYTLADRIAALRVLRPGIDPHIISSAGHWAAYEAPEAFNATLAGLLR